MRRCLSGNLRRSGRASLAFELNLFLLAFAVGDRDRGHLKCLACRDTHAHIAIGGSRLHVGDGRVRLVLGERGLGKVAMLGNLLVDLMKFRGLDRGLNHGGAVGVLGGRKFLGIA